jgi:serine/threonine protein kinase
MKRVVWSLGCILFEIMTLNPPYKDISGDKCENFVTKGIRPLLDYHRDIIPTEFWKNGIWNNLVIMFEKCTSLDSKNRPTVSHLLEILGKIQVEDFVDYRWGETDGSTTENFQEKLELLTISMEKAVKERDMKRVDQLLVQIQRLRSQYSDTQS